MRALAMVLLALCACCGGRPPRYPITDPSLVLRSLRARDEAVRSLRAQATADHFGREGRMRGSVYIFLERPARVRVDTQAFGNTLSAVASDGTTMRLVDYRNNRFFTGPARACVAAQLLGIPLEAAEVVAVLAGGPPLPEGNAALRWDRDHYALTLTGDGGREERLELTLTSAERDGARPEAQRPRPSRAELRDARGVRAVLTFEDYQDAQGVPFPRRVRLVMERADVDVLVRYREVELNPELPEEAWAPEPGASMETVPVACDPEP